MKHKISPYKKDNTKKRQIEILELRNAIIEIKVSEYGLNIRREATEERISKLKDTTKQLNLNNRKRID